MRALIAALVLLASSAASATPWWSGEWVHGAYATSSNSRQHVALVVFFQMDDACQPHLRVVRGNGEAVTWTRLTISIDGQPHRWREDEPKTLALLHFGLPTFEALVAGSGYELATDTLHVRGSLRGSRAALERAEAICRYKLARRDQLLDGETADRRT